MHLTSIIYGCHQESSPTRSDSSLFLAILEKKLLEKARLL
jgi:hypothetical protein